MTELLISPAEPAVIRAIGRVSSLTEELGADILFHSKAGWVGIQRKEIKDLIASCHDGRLAKEVAQLQDLPIRYLIIEGRPQWTLDGQLLSSYGKWTKKSMSGVRISLQVAGVHLLQTDSIQDTIAEISHLHEWWNKDSHGGLFVRPKPQATWGELSNRDYGIHLLQSFPSIGPRTAGNIYDYFEGRLPLKWEVSEAELAKIPGVGKVRAQGMIRVLSGTSVPAPSATVRKAKKSAPSPDSPTPTRTSRSKSAKTTSSSSANSRGSG